jgi:hypothetical protein
MSVILDRAFAINAADDSMGLHFFSSGDILSAMTHNYSFSHEN